MLPGHILRCIERLKTNEALRFDDLYDCTSPVACVGGCAGGPKRAAFWARMESYAGRR
jgi:hypothetical protein